MTFSMHDRSVAAAVVPMPGSAAVPMPGSAVILRNKNVMADDFALDQGAAPRVPQPNHPIQQRRSYHDLATEFKRVSGNNNRRHSMYEYDAAEVSATINLSEFGTLAKKAEDVVESLGAKNPEVKVTPASVAGAKDNDYDEVDFAEEKKKMKQKGEAGTLAVAKPPPRSSSSGSSKESDNIGRSIARKASVSANVAAISFLSENFSEGFRFRLKTQINCTDVTIELSAGRARTSSGGSGRWTPPFRT